MALLAGPADARFARSCGRPPGVAVFGRMGCVVE